MGNIPTKIEKSVKTIQEKSSLTLPQFPRVQRVHLASSEVWELAAVVAVVGVPGTEAVVVLAAAVVVSVDDFAAAVAGTAAAAGCVVAGDGLVQLWAFCPAPGVWEDLKHTKQLLVLLFFWTRMRDRWCMLK